MSTTPTAGQDQDRLLLSVDDAAARLGIGRTLLYAAIGRGELHSVRIGGRRLIRPADLTAYVDRLSA